MSTPAPQTISLDLHERFRDIIHARGPVDEIKLRYLKRDAEKLMSVDAISAHIILGGIAAVQFKDAEVDSHHRAAIRLLDISTNHGNYAVSLQYIQRRDEAADEAVVAADMDPLDQRLAHQAIKFLGIAGRLGEAMERLKVFQRIFPDSPTQDFINIPAALVIMRHYGIPEELVRTCQRYAFGLLRERKMRAEDIRLVADGEDKDASVSYFINVDAPIDTIIELDEELGSRIFDVCPDIPVERFWIGFDRAHKT